MTRPALPIHCVARWETWKEYTLAHCGSCYYAIAFLGFLFKVRWSVAATWELQEQDVKERKRVCTFSKGLRRQWLKAHRKELFLAVSILFLRLDHHRDEVWFAAVTDDGRYLASSSKERSFHM